MNTCDTCWWWLGTDISAGVNMRFCKKRMMPGSDESMQAEDIYPFTDYARIVTGPKFGCVHHQSVSALTDAEK